MTPPVIEVTVGTDISKSNNLRSVPVADVFVLAALIGRGAMHVSKLHPSLHTQADWLALPKSLKKEEPGLSRDRLKVKGNYLLAGHIAGSHRAVTAVDRVGLLVVDLDEGDLTEAEIRQRVGKHGAVFFETANSAPENKRWRLIMLLARELTAENYRDAVKAWALSWGAALDACSTRPAQPQLLPLSFDGYTPQVYLHDGERLALHEYLTGEASVLPGEVIGTDDAEARAQRALLNYRQPVGRIPRERIVGALTALDAGPRETWIKVGMALKHQYQDDDETGFEIWDEWSATAGDKYDPAQCRKEWGSFRANPPDRAPVTLLSIIPHAHALERTGRTIGAREKRVNEILNCNDEGVLRNVICPTLPSTEGLGDFDLDALIKAVQDWFKVRKMTVPSKAAVRSWMTPTPVVADIPDMGEEDWSQWVFVQALDEFVHIATKRRASITGFNAEFNRQFLIDGKLASPASVYVVNKGKVRTASNMLYLPGHDVVAPMNGIIYLNMWRADSVPEAAPSLVWSREEKHSIRTIIRLLCRVFEKRERRLLLEWASWLVCNERDHPNWSPLVQGPQGIGKTLIGEIMSAALGNVNVKIIDPHVLGTGFTSWAEGAKLAIIEEVRLPGEKGTSHAVVNALKPYITNDTISIHRKGVDPFNAPNVTGYLMFTNHEDALPVERGDRRHFVVFSRPRTEDEAKQIEEKHPTIFTDVVEAVRQHASAIRGALLHEVPRMKRSPDFNAKGRAPWTEAKAVMRDHGRPEDESLITELLTEKFEGCNPDGVVSTKHLMLRAAQIAPRLHVRSARIGLLLRNAGWERWCGGNKLRWRNEILNVWVKVNSGLNSNMHAPVLRDLLDASVGSEFGDEV